MLACRIVLVRTEIAGNIGAAARVMGNFGLGELVLVSPIADPHSEAARSMATHHATAILDRCRIVAELGEAVADCVAVAGTSARTGGLYRRQSVGPPQEVLPWLVAAASSGPVALVFGPEPSGLRNDEVVRCHHLIHIPTDEAHPALNLAQAVAICLYELRRCLLAFCGTGGSRAAPFEQQERMFALLESGLDAIGYLRGPGGDARMHAIRHLIGRAAPTPMEVRLLIGLARQMPWVAKRANLTEEGPPGLPNEDRGGAEPQENVR